MMTSSIHRYYTKAKKAFSEGGYSLLAARGVRLLYRNYSKFLPWITRQYNGVTVPSHKPTGALIPGVETDHRPDYEEGLVRSLEDNVRKGDSVVICGGGLGVSTVKASKLTNYSSEIRVYEGSESQIKLLKNTLELNEVGKKVTIRHAVVGDKKKVWGSAENADEIHPSALPACDLLELDIEGSELDLLKNLTIQPDRIIVETHGYLGAGTKEVKSVLEQKGYKIKNVDMADSSEHARQKDIKVITAKLD